MNCWATTLESTQGIPNYNIKMLPRKRHSSSASRHKVKCQECHREFDSDYASKDNEKVMRKEEEKKKNAMIDEEEEEGDDEEEGEESDVEEENEEGVIDEYGSNEDDVGHRRV